jgi:hypothetical protein
MMDGGEAWEDTMLECFVRECHQINEDDDSMVRASSRQTGVESNQKSSDFTCHSGSVVTSPAILSSKAAKAKKEGDVIDSLFNGRQVFFLRRGSTTWQHIRPSSKRFLTLVVTKLTRTSTVCQR